MTTPSYEPDHALELPPPLTSGELWESLAGDPGTAVSIMDEDEAIVYANEAAAQLYLGRAAVEVIGHRLDEFVPAVALDAYRLIASEAVRAGSPIVARTVWDGRQVLTTIRHVPNAEAPDHFVRIAHHVAGDSPLPLDIPSIEADVVELGPLDVLTPRELEVLCLIGQAMISKEIAEVLRCSVGTVHVHRRSIGHKLRTTDRVALARIAATAGLTLRDAHRPRIVRNEGDIT